MKKEPHVNEIKKLYIKETVSFASNHIPGVDQATLEKFLELINTTGTFGSISHEQLVAKMRLVMKYIPNACAYSLAALADLLEIPMTNFPVRTRSYPARTALLDTIPLNTLSRQRARVDSGIERGNLEHRLSAKLTDT